MREAAYAQLEKIAEKMALYITNKPDKERKPFELMAASDSLGRLRQQIIENKNRNASRANPLIQFTQSNQLAVFNTNSPQVMADSAIDSLKSLISKHIEKSGSEV